MESIGIDPHGGGYMKQNKKKAPPKPRLPRKKVPESERRRSSRLQGGTEKPDRLGVVAYTGAFQPAEKKVPESEPPERRRSLRLQGGTAGPERLGFGEPSGDEPLPAKKKKPAKKPAAKPASNAKARLKAERVAAAKAKAERDAVVAKAVAERDTATLAKLAKKEAAAQGDKMYGPARERFLAEGPDPVTKQTRPGRSVTLTKEVMLGKVDARVASKKTKAAKGAEWLDGMTDDAHFWVKVNHRCLPQENLKKKGDKVTGGGKRGSQKGQAAAKKARKA